MLAIYYPNGDRDYYKKLEAQKQAEQAAAAQKELEALLQAQDTARAMILNQAFVSTPPPSKIIPSQKVLKEIESLQNYLRGN